MKPFELSIEPTQGDTFRHGFHLGTDEIVARHLAEQEFHSRNRRGESVRTVALMLGHRMFDYYDGIWANTGSTETRNPYDPKNWKPIGYQSNGDGTYSMDW